MTEAVVACGVEPAGWQDIPKRISRLVPDAACLVQAADGRAYHQIGVVQHGMRPEFASSYAEHYFEVNPWVPFMRAQRTMRALVADDTSPARSFAGTEFYDDFLRPHGGIESAVGMKIFDEAERFAWIAIHYDSSLGARYNAPLARFLQGLGPAIRAALILNRELKTKTAATATADQILEALGLPAFILDRCACIRSANRLGMAACAERLIRIDFLGRLAPRQASGNLQFSAVVARLAAGEESQREIPLRSDGDRVAGILSLFPIVTAAADPALVWMQGPERLVLAILRDFRPRAAPAAGALKSLFGLTKAEARLAAHLASGEALDSAAAALGIARETARVQLKSVFAKTGTHRQAELVALLAHLNGIDQRAPSEHPVE
jgi:DNA-binding CsgD family transcriptional regulator